MLILHEQHIWQTSNCLHTSLSFMSAFSYILLDVRFSSLNYLELEELDVTSSLVVCVGRDQGN